METAPTGIDPRTLSRLAYKRIGRRGLRTGIEAEELVSIGVSAILETEADTEALAVTVARNAMFGFIRKSVIRERGRVPVRQGHAFACEGEAPSVGDMWDATVHHGQSLQPAARHFDLWEAMRGLTPQQYRAITLSFWGNMGIESVAEEMGISFGRVAQLLRAAQKNIKEALQKSQPQALTNVKGERNPAERSFGRNGSGE